MEAAPAQGNGLQLRWLDRFYLPATQLEAGSLQEAPFQHLPLEQLVGPGFRPYRTQLRAWQGILDGDAVFVVSGTGSGKTYAIVFGIFERLLRQRDAHCLILYPLKALAQDQEQQLRALGAQVGLTVQRYDSSVPSKVKAKIRAAPAPLLIITPDTLLGSLAASYSSGSSEPRARRNGGPRNRTNDVNPDSPADNNKGSRDGGNGSAG
ncbi:MAG: DEAD/DEAH box helicase, partial [Candidatus Helarchaeota archaeon]